MSDGVDLLCNALREVGIDVVFGVPGTQNVALFEGFRRHRLRTVLATHELAASFMANGYYRATGRPAVLATIPGPGFTYALTGLAEARLDSAGLVYLVGIPATRPGRAFQLQSIDQTAIASPLVKACYEITASDDAARVIREAHTAGADGRTRTGDGSVRHARPRSRRDGGNDVRIERGWACTVDRSRITRRVVDALQTRASTGVLPRRRRIRVRGALERIAKSLNIPVLTTPSARGIVPEEIQSRWASTPLRGHVDERIDCSIEPI